MNEELSQSMEDYIEAIALLSEKDGQAKANDIAESLKVKKPSVTSALKELARRGLVHYQKYMPITLTRKGAAQADIIIHKHKILQDFFENVLELPRGQAAPLACSIEHCLSDQAAARLERLSRYLEDCPRTGRENREKYIKQCADADARDRDCAECVRLCADRIVQNIQKATNKQGKETQTMTTTTLKDLRPGQTAVVQSVKGNAAFGKRAAQMGLLPGSPVKVLRVAPLGDPISVEVKGYELSLRKKEASEITVKPE